MMGLALGYCRLMWWRGVQEPVCGLAAVAPPPGGWIDLGSPVVVSVWMW